MATRRRDAAILATVGLVVIGLCLDLASRDVHSAAAMRWYPKCAIFALLQVRCPGCGATRAMHALLHGDLRGALGHNALFVLVGGPLALYGYASAWRRALTGRGLPAGAPRAQVAFAGLFLALVLAFFVARNVPALARLELEPGQDRLDPAHQGSAELRDPHHAFKLDLAEASVAALPALTRV